jgi:hypothetical protein
VREDTSPAWHHFSAWQLERSKEHCESNVQVTQKYQLCESTKNKTSQPPDMPKGKTDLADQEETKTIVLEKAVLDRKIIIGANLSQEEESELTETLAKNKDIFTW